MYSIKNKFELPMLIRYKVFRIETLFWGIKYIIKMIYAKQDMGKKK